jgi:hypothetical protein
LFFFRAALWHPAKKFDLGPPLLAFRTARDASISGPGRAIPVSSSIAFKIFEQKSN